MLDAILEPIRLAAAAGVSVGLIGFTLYIRARKRVAQLTRKLEHVRRVSELPPVPNYATREPDRPAFRPLDPQLCGGCGTMRDQEELNACPGETCEHFKKGVATQARL